MKFNPLVSAYSKEEETWNVVSHAFGLIASLVAFAPLITRAIKSGNNALIVSAMVFGLSLVLVYSASTFYHKSMDETKRRKLKILDHAAIYVLIAGTYTPFCIVTLNHTIGWTIFTLIWTMAIIGIGLKLFLTEKHSLVSTIIYVLMGWTVVFAVKPLMANLSPNGFFWLALGGIAYTIGAAFYVLKSVKFNHAIFHMFVLLGSICHFISIFNHVLN